MRNSVKRGWLMFGFGLAAIPLSAAAIAYACTGLATVSTSSSSATSGATVVVTGSGFAAHDPSDIRTEQAKVRFDDPSGDVVATASPTPANDGGKFSVQITVPALAAGDHVLIVTQNGSDGRPAFGTPARQAFAITAPAAVPAAVVAAAPVAAAPALAPIDVPVLSQPFVTPARERALSKAIASCRSRFSVTKAKTKRGKARMTQRRSACIKAARTRYA
jgi:hypothetical protein